MNTEDHTSKKKSLRWSDIKEAKDIFSYVLPYKWFLFGALLMLVFSSVLTLAFPYLAGLMTNVATGNSDMDIDLRTIGYFLIVILIIQGFVSFIQVVLNAIVSENAMADLRRALYAKMISLPIYFYEKNRVGELISRIASDVAKLQGIFASTILGFIRQVIILILGIILLLILTPRLSLIMLLTFPVVVVGALFFGRYLRKNSKLRQSELAETNVIVEETLHNIKSVKAFTNEKFEIKRYNNRITALVKTSLKLARIRGLFSSFIVVLLFGGMFAMLWLGAKYVQDGKMLIGDLVSFIAYTGFIGGAIASLGTFYSEIIAAIGGTERIREILNTKSELNIDSDKKIKVKGAVEFNDVSFAYPSRSDFEVLKNMSFIASPGDSIALVGHSGAGKSTIIQLLMRYYGEYTGQILIDDKPLSSFEHMAYRDNVAIVPQEIILFGGTIKENILYGNPDASEDQLIQAAKQSNCFEFIQRFPEGFDTMVGDRGVKLSGGQKQRVAIARAILKDPSILILDEATSSLDTESERLVQDALERLMKGRTTFIIAHRLSTIKNVDRILVIQDGNIAEAGTHQELYEIQDGIYSKLAKLQFE